MGFINFRRERLIRKMLRKLSKQRVAMILQPGNVWVVEKSVSDDDETEAALRTCHLRGWIEPVVDALPKGKLTPNGKLPKGQIFNSHGPVYRLTDAGWSAIYRSHHWVVATWLVALASFVATVVSILVRYIVLLK